MIEHLSFHTTVEQITSKIHKHKNVIKWQIPTGTVDEADASVTMIKQSKLKTDSQHENHIHMRVEL
jgi:predicted  nucleic acid-binding Zn ribbon protein